MTNHVILRDMTRAFLKVGPGMRLPYPDGAVLPLRSLVYGRQILWRQQSPLPTPDEGSPTDPEPGPGPTPEPGPTPSGYGVGEPDSEPGAGDRQVEVASYAALQSAINAAREGDEIIVANGEYAGNTLTIACQGSRARPIRIRAAQRLGANLPNGFRLLGRHCIVDGLRVAKNASASRTEIGGFMNAVRRCAFRTQGGNQVVAFVAGSHGKLVYCSFEPWTPSDSMPDIHGVTAWGSGSARHFRGEIGNVLFRDYPSKPAGSQYATLRRCCVVVGQGAAQRTVEDRFFLYNIVMDQCGTSRLSINSSRNLVRHCIVRNNNRTPNSPTRGTDIGARFGENNRFEGCTTLGEKHMNTDRFNKWVSCKGHLEVFGGDGTYQTRPIPQFVRSESTLVVDHRGTVEVGKRYSSHNLPALATRIEVLGNVNITHGSHQQTSTSESTGEALLTPTELTANQVGPLA